MSSAKDSGPAVAQHATRRPDLPRLTAGRGIGAVTIVLGHFTLTRTFQSEQLNLFAMDLIQAFAVAGLGYFFTLSGFVLTWAITPGTPARKFWRGRVARLFPLHAATWTFGIAMMIICGVTFEFWKMLPSLALIQVWIPNLDIFWGPNTPAWTLAVEAFFYLLFPVLLVTAWKLPERWLMPLVFVIAALITAWAGVVAIFVDNTPDVTDGTPLSRAQYFAIVCFAPARLLDFVLGILLARIVIAGRAPSGLRPWLYLTLIGGYVVARWGVPQPLGFVFAFLPAAIVTMLYAATADVAKRPSKWVNRGTLWLGAISFPLYLVHWPVVFGVHLLLGSPTLPVPLALLLGLTLLAISITLAFLLHRWVELPMYRRYRVRRKDQIAVRGSRAVRQGVPPHDGPPSGEAPVDGSGPLLGQQGVGAAERS